MRTTRREMYNALREFWKDERMLFLGSERANHLQVMIQELTALEEAAAKEAFRNVSLDLEVDEDIERALSRKMARRDFYIVIRGLFERDARRYQRAPYVVRANTIKGLVIKFLKSLDDAPHLLHEPIKESKFMHLRFAKTA